MDMFFLSGRFVILEKVKKKHKKVNNLASNANF